MLDQIKKGRELGKTSFSETEIDWLIKEAEKVRNLEESLEYVITAEPEHYRDKKHMLEDFKIVIDLYR